MRLGRGLVFSALVAGLIVLLLSGRWIAALISELLWYRSLDLESVFWTRFRATVAVRGTVALLVWVAIYANLSVVTRSLGAIRLRRRYANIEIAERLPRVYIVSVISAVALVSAWWLSAEVANPLPILAAFSPERWGLADPVFGRDAAFYVFRLPILRQFLTLSSLLVFWAFLIAAAAYVATGAIKFTETRPVVIPLARRHLGFLTALFIALYGLHVAVSRYTLVVNGNGFNGALGYTDIHARLPAKLILLILALACAAAVAYGSWIGKPGLPFGAAILLVVGWVGGEKIYPASIQRFVVEPNQLPSEEEYIRQHLEFTRRAFRLDAISEVVLPYQAERSLDPNLLVESLEGVPLWDPRPLLTAYQQRQALFPYYTFASVHYDRYRRGDALEPVAVSVREMDTAELEDVSRTWQNIHLTYVAGEGAVASPVAQMAEDGTPVFYLWDREPVKLAPDAPPDLALENPRIFFGERTTEYVIVGAGDEPIGVPLSGTWRKILFAWAFQSKNLLLSGDLGQDSKIVYRRDIVQRVQAIAPFLTVSTATNRGPHPIIDDGHVVWMVDAYTTSPSFPLSQTQGFENRGVRYIRNSVKVTVDAVTGEVRFYTVDDSDPILATYSRLFPGLFRPLSEMPATLQPHLRYPAEMTQLQAQVLGSYHLTDPRNFYEQQDAWSLATELYRGTPITMEPTYSMFRLPGSDQLEFLLSIPFTPRGRQNMTALFVTRNDPPSYGEQILYLLPRDQVVLGPQQIEAVIDQNPEISQQLSLWLRGGSQVARGNLMIIPVDSTLVYVEPLFLEAENAAIPQLERVILSQAGDVVMEATFGAAVDALLRGQGAGVASGDSGRVSTATSAAGEPGALSAARRLMSEADAHLRAGDWAAFGRTWQALRDLLADSGGGF